MERYCYLLRLSCVFEFGNASAVMISRNDGPLTQAILLCGERDPKKIESHLVAIQTAYNPTRKSEGNCYNFFKNPPVINFLLYMH